MTVDRRKVLGGLALATSLPAAQAMGKPLRAPTGDKRQASERRGYADGPMGQTHYRVQGDGPVVLLLHETPWYSVQYTKVQPLLAQAGFRSIAPDTPGSGFSPAPGGDPSLHDYAAQMIAVLDALKVKRATIIGDHTGAAIAVRLAAAFPSRVEGIVTYGVPLYSDAERRDRLGRFNSTYAPPLRLREDGTHLSDRFTYVRRVIDRETGSLEAVQESTVSYMLAADRQWHALHAVFTHPTMAGDLRAVRAPGLFLSSADDSLHQRTLQARALRPDFGYHAFNGGGPHLVYDQPQPWSEAVTRFLGTLPRAR